VGREGSCCLEKRGPGLVREISGGEKNYMQFQSGQAGRGGTENFTCAIKRGARLDGLVNRGPPRKWKSIQGDPTREKRGFIEGGRRKRKNSALKMGISPETTGGVTPLPQSFVRANEFPNLQGSKGKQLFNTIEHKGQWC